MDFNFKKPDETKFAKYEQEKDKAVPNQNCSLLDLDLSLLCNVNIDLLNDDCPLDVSESRSRRRRAGDSLVSRVAKKPAFSGSRVADHQQPKAKPTPESDKRPTEPRPELTDSELFSEALVDTQFLNQIDTSISNRSFLADNDRVIKCDQSSPSAEDIASLFDTQNDIRLSGSRSPATTETNRPSAIEVMVNENEQALDDEFLDSQLSAVFASSQYRKELESVFDQCKQSILKSDTTVSSAPKPRLNKERSPPCSSLAGILNRFKAPVNKPKSVVHAPVSSHFFVIKGPFYGLPLQVKTLIQEYKGIDELYDWQDTCLRLPAITQRKNLIYALPTSGGKTLVAEILIMREIICRQKNVLFILPYVSIVQEKVWALSPFAVAMDFLVEEYAAGKGVCPPRKRRKKHSVYVATIEKAMALVDSLLESSRANEIGLVVVDELHLLGEPSRGYILEMILTKLMFINAGTQIVGMSATIGNLDEVATFLSAETFTRDFRPVELKEYIKLGPEIFAIDSEAVDPTDLFVHSRTLDYQYSDVMAKVDPDMLTGLVQETIPQHSCLIFCSSKRNCESVALLLATNLPRKIVEHRKSEKETLLRAIKFSSGTLCKVLMQTIPYGIAYHHSGLTSDERRHLEEGFRRGIISTICCTSTLAAGVNLPARRVILRSPYVGTSFLTLSKYKQMVGRAGRTGMAACGESILLATARDKERVRELLHSPMDRAESALLANQARGFRSLVLSAIGLNLTACRRDLHALVRKTLLSVQAHRIGINPTEVTDKLIRKLFHLKALQVRETRNAKLLVQPMPVSVEIHSTQNQVVGGNDTFDERTQPRRTLVMKSTTPLEISALGKAAVRACIDLSRAKVLYDDLRQAQMSLVLVDYLHLLFIVTPYDMSETITPDMSVYYSIFVKLKADELQTARVIGLTEACAAKMITGTASFSPNISRILNRFFVTLILNDLWSVRPVHEVADKFRVNRGLVQSLMSTAATHASSVLRFCEEFPEFWAFKELLGQLTKRLSYCCGTELLPLMELPAVKLGRAKQLYAAGFRNLETVAKSSVQQLVDGVEYMSARVARQLIAAAKLLLLERVETLREEAQQVLDVLDLRNSH